MTNIQRFLHNGLDEKTALALVWYLVSGIWYLVFGIWYLVYSMTTRKIKSFTDLIAWQEGHKLVIMVYKITEKFPKSELFSLTDQMRRSAISITSNIAEGFSRQGKKEKIQFYYMTLGSTTELQNQLLIARDLNYLENEEFSKIAKKTVSVAKLTNSLITYLKNHV